MPIRKERSVDAVDAADSLLGLATSPDAAQKPLRILRQKAGHVSSGGWARHQPPYYQSGPGGPQFGSSSVDTTATAGTSVRSSWDSDAHYHGGAGGNWPFCCSPTASDSSSGTGNFVPSLAMPPPAAPWPVYTYKWHDAQLLASAAVRLAACGVMHALQQVPSAGASEEQAHDPHGVAAQLEHEDRHGRGRGLERQQEEETEQQTQQQMQQEQQQQQTTTTTTTTTEVPGAATPAAREKETEATPQATPQLAPSGRHSPPIKTAGSTAASTGDPPACHLTASVWRILADECAQVRPLEPPDFARLCQLLDVPLEVGAQWRSRVLALQRELANHVPASGGGGGGSGGGGGGECAANALASFHELVHDEAAHASSAVRARVRLFGRQTVWCAVGLLRRSLREGAWAAGQRGLTPSQVEARLASIAIEAIGVGSRSRRPSGE